MVIIEEFFTIIITAEARAQNTKSVFQLAILKVQGTHQNKKGSFHSDNLFWGRHGNKGTTHA
jgi:hypothetical protein